MRIRPGIEVPDATLIEVCERYQVRELAVFGSSARGDFGTDSDVDVLVDFAPGASIGFVEFLALREELEGLVGVRVDLVSKRGLKPLVRSGVLADARTLYAA